MAIRANVSSTGSQPMHADAICGELGPNVAAAGSTQATATLLRRLTRHVVTSGTGGVIVMPGVGLGDQLDYGDEIEITNASGSQINIYPPLAAAFYGSATNAAVTLADGFSVSVLKQNATTYQARYYFTATSAGSVSSVALTAPTEITVGGSPITTTGTFALTWTNQTQYKVFASPAGSTGTPAFRAMVALDLPSTAVTPGSYTAANITVDQQGRITAAANGAAGGTVTSVSVVTANGVSGSVATATTTPAITLVLGAITPSSVVASGTVTASNISGATSGTNTGDQTITLTGDVTGTGTGSFAATVKTNLKISTIWIPIEGGGVAITTGLKYYLQVEFDCTITANTLLSETSTTSVVNIWKCTYSQYDVSTHPVSGDKITASAPPTLTAAVKSTDSTLTGWTTTITAGDILAINVDSNNNATKLALMLKVIKT